jgi:hypothetical protein
VVFLATFLPYVVLFFLVSPLNIIFFVVAWVAFFSAACVLLQNVKNFKKAF